MGGINLKRSKIKFQYITFNPKVLSVIKVANKMKKEKLKVGFTSESEGLQKYIDTMKRINHVMDVYEKFIVTDMDRIQKLVNKLQKTDDGLSKKINMK